MVMPQCSFKLIISGEMLPRPHCGRPSENEPHPTLSEAANHPSLRTVLISTPFSFSRLNSVHPNTSGSTAEFCFPRHTMFPKNPAVMFSECIYTYLYMYICSVCGWHRRVYVHARWEQKLTNRTANQPIRLLTYLPTYLPSYLPAYLPTKKPHPTRDPCLHDVSYSLNSWYSP